MRTGILRLLGVTGLLLAACGTPARAPTSPPMSADPTDVPTTSASQSSTASALVPPSTELGGAAWSTKYGFDGIWIQVDPPIDQMIRIDTDTGSVAMAIDGGAGVAFTDDALWVALPGQAEFQKLDPVSGDTLASISEKTAYLASGAGSIWAVAFDGRVIRVDPETGELLAAIPIEATELTDIAVSDDGAWVTAKEDGRVFRIDPATNRVVADIRTGAGAHGIVIDGSGVWVTNYRANTVSRIDPAANEVVATVEGVGSGVGITAGDGAIWVSTQGQGISRIDPTTNEAALVVKLPNEWNYGIAYADGDLWISSVDRGLVYRVAIAD
jgi:YVTN family beta-propeller protein